ncbi:MAG: ABC transporter permease, partial [Verrucomicrobia bacterium]|nr:ABC transporter permease [Verrucomicrobiota bacterium]
MNSGTPAATASIEPPPARIDHLEQGSSLWKDAWYRLKKNDVALFGLWAFGVVGVLCLV